VGGETFYPKLVYLVRAGFTEAEAAMILLAISEYTLGCVLEEQSRTYGNDNKMLSKIPAEIAHIESLVNPHPDTAFEYGLSLIIKGLSMPSA
jgi:TetR/AcrR family tetracycline transcriptional repressor